MNPTLRRFLRSWHWVWVIAGSLIAGLSLALGDARPLLVVVWWMGFIAIGVIMLIGMVGAFVMMAVGIRQNLVSRRKEKRARTS